MNNEPTPRTDAEYLRLKDDAKDGLDLSPGSDTSKYAVQTIDGLDLELAAAKRENEELKSNLIAIRNSIPEHL